MTKSRSLSISVFGLGYVGGVSAACLARDGHRVTGVDVHPAKVAQLARGESPIVEPGLPELLHEAHVAGRLTATTDVAAAVTSADLALICVGTPSGGDGAIDLQYVERVVRQIAETLPARERPLTILLRSTVVPGTTERLVRPIIQSVRTRADVRLGFHPEFLRESTAIADYDAPARVVVGTDRQEVADDVVALYPRLPNPPVVTTFRVAEIIKYSDNAFHALKVAYANEIGAICKAYEVDGRDVLSLFVQDHKLNISPVYLRPGGPFGGSCLPKDLRALTNIATRQHVDTPLLRAVLGSNTAHKKRVFDLIHAHGRGRVAMLGLAFKPMTDDLRESPFVELAETLLGKGHELAIFDPAVRPASLMGSNLSYIQAELPHLERLLADSLDAALDGARVVIVATKQPAFAGVTDKLGPNHVLVDLAGFVDKPSSLRCRYEAICW